MIDTTPDRAAKARAARSANATARRNDKLAAQLANAGYLVVTPIELATLGQYESGRDALGTIADLRKAD